MEGSQPPTSATPAPKASHDSETPAHGHQVIVACALIHRQDATGRPQVFVAKRAATKKFLPDVFEIPGGHIDFGEDIVAGLKREIREEFDIDIAVGEPFAAFTEINPVKGAHFVEVVYFATLADPTASIRLHPADHSEYRWVGSDDIESIQTPAKGLDDNEIHTLRRGLELLSGHLLDLGHKAHQP